MARGGKRPGSGRKAVGNRVAMMVRVDREFEQRIERLRNGKSLSKTVELLLLDALKNSRRHDLKLEPAHGADLINPEEFFMTIKEQFNELLEGQNTLWMFRRHSDWGVALNRAKARHPELFVTLDDGRRALTTEKLALLCKITDREFIEDVIRKE